MQQCAKFSALGKNTQFSAVGRTPSSGNPCQDIFQSVVSRGVVSATTVPALAELYDNIGMTARPGALLQVEVHCHWRNDRTIDWCKQEGIHVTAYAPLSSPQTMRKEGKDVPNLLKVLFPLLLVSCCRSLTNGIAAHMHVSKPCCQAVILMSISLMTQNPEPTGKPYIQLYYSDPADTYHLSYVEHST